jgi:hypothetical protein
MTDSTESDSLAIAALLERWSRGEKQAYDQTTVEGLHEARR